MSPTNPEGAPPLSRFVRQGGDFDFPSCSLVTFVVKGLDSFLRVLCV